MRHSLSHAFRWRVVCFLCFSSMPALAWSQCDSPHLTAEDRQFLGGLVKQFLFDPSGAQRVRVTVTARTVWARSHDVPRDGWLVTKNGQARVYFADGESVVAPGEKGMAKVDFLAGCRQRYGDKPAEVDQDKDNRKVFDRMDQFAIGMLEEHDLTLAAWLLRLGNDDLAEKAFLRARTEASERHRDGKPATHDQLAAGLRQQLAWRAYAGLVHAYMVREDAEARSNGERLLRLYAKEADDEFPQAKAVMAELDRRAKKPAAALDDDGWPVGFDAWDRAKRISYLIESLDEVDARQRGQPGGVALGDDKRVQKLIAIGEAAVPALIDALESDPRLTRSVHFWRDFAPNRTVLDVREPVLVAIMSILRVRVFTPVSTGDSLTARGDGAAQGVAKELRAYWKAYGDIPFPERMMRVLTDPKSSFEAVQEAARNLATLGEKETIGTTVWTNSVQSPPTEPNPVIARFNGPTVAEAILAAMDRNLESHDKDKDDSLYDYRRRQIEDTYLFGLMTLGDHRIAAELVRRGSAADSVRMRRKWAFACEQLGRPELMVAYARDVEQGKIALPANEDKRRNDNEQPGVVELLGMVEYLADSRIPEANRALLAFTDPKHPYHSDVVHWVTDAREDAWRSHPYCLRIFRQRLDDTSSDSREFRIEGDSLIEKGPKFESKDAIPQLLSDPATRLEAAHGQACDAAVKSLHALVFGLPEYHPLLKNGPQILADTRLVLDRYMTSYRRANWQEIQRLGLSWHPKYLPDVSPLGRQATPEDVKAGQAVFYLEGKTEPLTMKLPAVASIKSEDAKGDRSKRGDRSPVALIVQAERDAAGKVHFGIFDRHGPRRVGEDELTVPQPLDAPDEPAPNK